MIERYIIYHNTKIGEERDRYNDGEEKELLADLKSMGKAYYVYDRKEDKDYTYSQFKKKIGGVKDCMKINKRRNVIKDADWDYMRKLNKGLIKDSIKHKSKRNTIKDVPIGYESHFKSSTFNKDLQNYKFRESVIDYKYIINGLNSIERDLDEWVYLYDNVVNVFNEPSFFNSCKKRLATYKRKIEDILNIINSKNSSSSNIKYDEEIENEITNIKEKFKLIDDIFAELDNTSIRKDSKKIVNRRLRKDSFKRYEALWYYDNDDYDTAEFSTEQALKNFYKKHKNDPDKSGWWLTKRNKDWEVIEDISTSDSVNKKVRQDEYYSRKENEINRQIKGRGFEMPNGDYLGIELHNGTLVAGAVTNGGIFNDYSIKYDFDSSLDRNLQELYDEIINSGDYEY